MKLKRIIIVGVVVTLIAGISAAALLQYFYTEEVNVSHGHMLKLNGVPLEETYEVTDWSTNVSLYNNITLATLVSAMDYSYNITLSPTIEGIDYQMYLNGERVSNPVQFIKNMDYTFACNISFNPLLEGGDYQLFLSIS